MSTPSFPPYLGSYEDIVNALLHNPLWGSGHVGHIPHVQAEADELNPQPLPPRAGPGDPDPWRNAAVRYLATLVNLRELSRAITDQDTRGQLAQSAETGIQAFLDDFCGTPPRRIPWPWPGPPPWVALLAVELTAAANTQTGALREGLMEVAGRIATLGLSAPKGTGASA